MNRRADFAKFRGQQIQERCKAVRPQTAKEPLAITYRQIGVGKRKKHMHVAIAKGDLPI